MRPCRIGLILLLLEIPQEVVVVVEVQVKIPVEEVVIKVVDVIVAAEEAIIAILCTSLRSWIRKPII